MLPCLAGVPGVRPDRFEEGLAVKHCALSLVGEPIMYPEINAFLRLLHQQRISSFLVTNAQFPDEIRYALSTSPSQIAPLQHFCFELRQRASQNISCLSWSFVCVNLKCM